MSKKKENIVYTSFVEASESTLEKLFNTSKKDDENIENNEVDGFDENGEKEKTKQELLEDAKIVRMMLKVAFFVIVFSLNFVAAFSFVFISKISSGLAVLFVVLSVLSLYFSWSVVKVMEQSRFKKLLKVKMSIPLLLSLGTGSFRWIFYMFLMVVFNFFMILVYVFLFKSLEIKGRVTKEKLQKKIQIGTFILFAIGMLFNSSAILNNDTKDKGHRSRK